MSYHFLRQLHTLTALITIAGFVLRGHWMLTASEKLQHRVIRIAPHIVDALFLASGLGMLLILSLNPLSQGWPLAKFAGLIVYIVLGTVALRRGPTPRIRTIAFVAALAVIAYVVGVALSKSAARWIGFPG